MVVPSKRPSTRSKITSSMASCKTLPCVGCRAHVYPRMRKIPWHKGVRAGGRKLLAQQCTDRVNEVAQGGMRGEWGKRIMSCSERVMFSGVAFLHSLATIYSIHTFGIGRPKATAIFRHILQHVFHMGPGMFREGLATLISFVSPRASREHLSLRQS